MKTVGQRLREAREVAGYRSAREAADAIGIAYPTYAAHENDSRGLRRDSAEVYARRFKVSIDWLLTGKGNRSNSNVVQVVGIVGAGQYIEAIFNGVDTVEAPPETDETTVAVIVRGDSMLPFLEDGSVIYYSKQLPPGEMVNRRCVVQLTDGRAMVKTLRVGSKPGRWILTSLNAGDLVDVEIEWAAKIDWIKPK